MNDAHKKYYKDMCDRDRGFIFVKYGHVIAIVTFFIGSDDGKYLINHIPWTVVDDDPEGETLYIDQFLVNDHKAKDCIHREFYQFRKWAKTKFKNLKRTKWVRVNAEFRKHGLQEGVKSNVHTKSIE